MMRPEAGAIIPSRVLLFRHCFLFFFYAECEPGAIPTGFAHLFFARDNSALALLYSST